MDAASCGMFMHVQSSNKNSLKGNRALNQTKSLKLVLGAWS